MQDLTTFPELIRLDDRRYGDSYSHRYEGRTYRLFWADYPKKEEAPLVYLLSADKTEGSRVEDETLANAVAEDWWRERDYRIQHIGRDEVCFPPKTPPVTGPVPGFFAGQMSAAAGGKNPLLPDAPAEAGWTCPRCGTPGNRGKFCPECGGKWPDGPPSPETPVLFGK